METELLQRLERIEAILSSFVKQHPTKEFYATDEVAEILGRAPYTVREWCRLGRIHAQKRRCGRGASKDWMISHAELQRLRNEGLMPIGKDK